MSAAFNMLAAKMVAKCTCGRIWVHPTLDGESGESWPWCEKCVFDYYKRCHIAIAKHRQKYYKSWDTVQGWQLCEFPPQKV